MVLEIRIKEAYRMKTQQFDGSFIIFLVLILLVFGMGWGWGWNAVESEQA